MITSKQAAMLAMSWISLALSQPLQAQDAGRTGVFPDGSKLYVHYIAHFWRTNPANTVLIDDPNERAPGYIHPVKIRIDPGIPKPLADSFLRKVRVLFDTLMSQPSLRDPHGVSLVPIIDINRAKTGRMTGTVRVLPHRIRLSRADTKNFGGRYYTPDEPSAIRIRINSVMGSLSHGGSDHVEKKGAYNGAQVAEIDGTSYSIYVAGINRDPIVTRCCDPKGKPEQDFVHDPEKDFYDTSLPPTKIQMLEGRVWEDQYQMIGVRQELVPPTGATARLYGALFTMDWPDVLRRMEEAQ